MVLLCDLWAALTASCRVRSLEGQVTDLQKEATRLLRSLDIQKEEAAKQAAHAKRRHDELSKQGETSQTELTSLRNVVKQFSDYDEIKRELEIMKVCRLAYTGGHG